jgi:CheY-like chemotaxis protein
LYKLLIVEDSVKERQVYQHLLDCYSLFQGNYQSLDIIGSLDFLKTLSSQTGTWPEVLLLDLDSSASCGWNFLSELELLADTATHKPHVYIVSSTINLDDRLRVQKMPFVKDYFPKPLSRHVLLSLHDRYNTNHRLVS